MEKLLRDESPFVDLFCSLLSKHGIVFTVARAENRKEICGRQRGLFRWRSLLVHGRNLRADAWSEVGFLRLSEFCRKNPNNPYIQQTLTSKLKKLDLSYPKSHGSNQKRSLGMSSHPIISLF